VQEQDDDDSDFKASDRFKSFGYKPNSATENHGFEDGLYSIDLIEKEDKKIKARARSFQAFEAQDIGRNEYDNKREREFSSYLYSQYDQNANNDSDGKLFSDYMYIFMDVHVYTCVYI
jgi:hypothetical protein